MHLPVVLHHRAARPRWASNVDEFKLKVQGISTTSEMSRDQMATAAQAGGVPEITRFGGH